MINYLISLMMYTLNISSIQNNVCPTGPRPLNPLHNKFKVINLRFTLRIYAHAELVEAFFSNFPIVNMSNQKHPSTGLRMSDLCYLKSLLASCMEVIKGTFISNISTGYNND